MEINTFFTSLENYYGPYKGDSKVKEFVRRYILRDIDPLKYDKLLRFITYYHASRFGAPGISDIEKAIKEAIKDGKGSDVHMIRSSSYEEQAVSDDEYKKGVDILSKTGGFRNMIDELVSKKNINKKDDN